MMRQKLEMSYLWTQLIQAKLDHVALYVGDQTILQHCVKRLSSRETYDEKWIECTKKRYRYAK